MLTALVAFLGVSALVICTPGQDTGLTIRNTLSGGRASGFATAADVALGQAVWTAAASFGIAALIAASEPAFLALRIAGAVYLVFLGLQTLWGAFRRRGARTIAMLLGLGLAFSLMTFVWLSAYALAVARTSTFLLRPRVRRAFDAITGAVLVAFGVRLATSR